MTKRPTFFVVAVFKNETTNLQEWLEHYIWQGASHFFLVDNGSDDNPLEILRPYIHKKLVSYIYNSGQHIQLAVNRQISEQIQELENAPEWILIADIDEFWFGTEKLLVDELEEIPYDKDVIYTHWYEFGPSADGFQPKSLRKELVYRNPTLLSPKFCFRTDCIDRDQINIHHIDIDTSKVWCNDNIIRCHHYYCQSTEYWNTVKIPRGHINGDLSVYDKDFEKRATPCTMLDTTLADMLPS